MGNYLSARTKNEPEIEPYHPKVKVSQNLTIGLTEVQNESFEYYWIVKNFSQLEEGSTIKSPKFTGYGQNWVLALGRVKGKSLISAIMMGLNSPGCKELSKKFKITFTLNGSKIEKFSTVIKKTRKKCPKVQLWLWPFVVNYPDKVENDQIVIGCQILLQKPLTKSQLVDDEFLNSLKLKPGREKNLEKFLSDFGKLWKNPEEQWDLSISVDGRDFKAHKAILSARSPVFSRMLSTHMKEAQSSIIRIDDFDPEIVECMLEFIYTGKTDIGQNALELFHISDKYDLPDLKTECEVELVKNLNFENALGFFDIGDKFNAPLLKSQSIEFTIRNEEEILKLPEFKENLKNNSQLSFELLRAVLEDKKGQNPKINLKPITL